jgi:putative heme-binding domain-containing protein
MQIPSWESMSHILALAAYVDTRESRELIQSYLRHDRAEIRYQALMAARECPEALDLKLLRDRLVDEDWRVRRAAIEFERHCESTNRLKDDLIATAATSDRCVRLALAWCLAERGDDEFLHELLEHDSAAVRLTGVLTLGTRLTCPEWNAPLPEDLKLSRSTAEDIRPDQEPRVGLFVVSDWHHAVGLTPHRERALQTLQRRVVEDPDLEVRMQALRFLILLKESSCVPVFVTLTGDREAAVRDLAIRGLLAFEMNDGEAPAWLAKLLTGDSFSTETRALAIGKARDVLLLRKLVLNHGQAPEIRSAALRRLHAIQDAGLSAVIALIEPDAADELTQTVGQLTGGQIDATETEARSRQIASEIENADWEALLKRGNPSRGKTLFARPNIQGVSCRTCHTYQGEGGTYGPGLDDARARLKADYVARSILFPSDDIVPEFRTMHISLLGGQSSRGVIVGEEGNSVTLARSDGTTESIPTSRISWRTPDNASIMPQGQVHTFDELIDLVAYLMPP